MDDEAEVGLVESHAQRAGRDERLDPVVLQERLGLLALVGIGLAGVRAHLVAAVAQQPGGVVRGRDGERVDDPRAREIAEVADEPREPARRVGQPQHAEPQRGARERSADDQDLGCASALVERAELLGDIRHDPAVGGRGRREHGNPGGYARDEVAEPPVVGAEVVPPVADAVRLVDDEQSDPRHQLRQLLVAERRVVEPLGRHQQHVDLVTVELCEHITPLVRVRGVDRDRPHARALRRGDLVAHERQQRRDQHGGPGAAPAQEQRRDEVHRRLAPPGALHHERPAAAVDERLDRLELAVVEVGVVTADEGAQDVECLGPHGRRRGHALNPASCH